MSMPDFGDVNSLHMWQVEVSGISEDVRIWPFSKMGTDAVSGDKLPSPPSAVKTEAVAVHKSCANVLGTFATRVLNPGTGSARGRSRRLTA